MASAVPVQSGYSIRGSRRFHHKWELDIALDGAANVRFAQSWCSNRKVHMLMRYRESFQLGLAL